MFRLSQALLLRLLAPSPTQRPRSMDHVLAHPFFLRDDSFEVPELRDGELNHLFLSHFQGNAVRKEATSACICRIALSCQAAFGIVVTHERKEQETNFSSLAFQGPRVMTVKYAIQEAVPGALVWLDQDARNKTVDGAHD